MARCVAVIEVTVNSSETGVAIVEVDVQSHDIDVVVAGVPLIQRSDTAAAVVVGRPEHQHFALTVDVGQSSVHSLPHGDELARGYSRRALKVSIIHIYVFISNVVLHLKT